jgi:hypothetical protein
MFPELKTLSKDIIKTVHFHKAATLHPRIFKTKCEDTGSSYKSLLRPMGVRWYLMAKGSLQINRLISVANNFSRLNEINFPFEGTKSIHLPTPIEITLT